MRVWLISFEKLSAVCLNVASKDILVSANKTRLNICLDAASKAFFVPAKRKIWFQGQLQTHGKVDIRDIWGVIIYCHGLAR